MSIKEAYVEAHLRRRVKALGGLAVKVVPVSMPGLPDRLVILPGGVHWWVELKRPGGVPAPHQLRVHALLQRMGCHVMVIDSVAGVDRWLEETTGGLLQRD